MFAQARQIHHERVFKLAIHLFLHGVEVFIGTAFAELPTQQLFPVRAADDFIHPFAADQRTWTGGRLTFTCFSGMQVLVVIGKGLVIIINARHHGIGEDFSQHGAAAPQTWRQLAVDFAYPTAFPFLLVFPGLGITYAGFGLDIVKPGIFHTFTPGPDVFTGHRTGVAANTFIQIQNHSDL